MCREAGCLQVENMNTGKTVQNDELSEPFFIRSLLVSLILLLLFALLSIAERS